MISETIHFVVLSESFGVPKVIIPSKIRNEIVNMLLISSSFSFLPVFIHQENRQIYHHLSFIHIKCFALNRSLKF